jgi:hypothetical protein
MQRPSGHEMAQQYQVSSKQKICSTDFFLFTDFCVLFLFRFEGGLVERNFHLSEALAAVLEVFTLMKSTVDPL